MKELSGIALREAVAVKVMGLTDVERARWIETMQNESRGLEWVLDADASGIELMCDEDRCPVPAYESDIAAAWLVVEKMREKGYHPRTRDCGEKRQWAFYDHKSGHEREHRWAVCNKDAEAICRAALAAMEAK